MFTKFRDKACQQQEDAMSHFGLNGLYPFITWIRFLSKCHPDKGTHSNSCDRTIIAKKLRFGGRVCQRRLLPCLSSRIIQIVSSTLRKTNNETQRNAHDSNIESPKFVVEGDGRCQESRMFL